MPRQLQTDRWMFGSTLALCLIGAIMVFSASAVTARDEYGNGSHFLLRQLLWLAFGLGGMMAVMNLDYRKLRRPEVIFTALFAVLVMLAGVFFLDKSHATHRWIRLGPASLQPSELAKLAVIFYLAWFLEMRRRPDSFGINDWKHTILPALGPVLVLVGLVVIEPDLGTAVEIFIIAVAMLYVAGLNGKYIIGAGLAALPIIYLLIVRVSYRYERVIAFLNPTADPQ
ncbi:MAG TPA: FtsW/RodA/SpoVE family cell cycle protein, partial [Verrucomicrobiae bacterium]|nr:FtsW/RodA/SpoVE family cell cycle protein [Verrucomicrobiae bacterium]